ncbi:MAG: hypothetical protein C0524_11785 [Rhodobacter sp.]|nr:hypothetical protein [Rhodobacter sp.]
MERLHKEQEARLKKAGLSNEMLKRPIVAQRGGYHGVIPLLPEGTCMLQQFARSDITKPLQFIPGRWKNKQRWLVEACFREV